MTAFVVNTNGVYFAEAGDADYVVARDDVEARDIIGDMLADDTDSLDEVTVKRVSVALLADIATAAAAYLREQANGTGLHDNDVRGPLVDLLIDGGFGEATDFDGEADSD